MPNLSLCGSITLKLNTAGWSYRDDVDNKDDTNDCI